MKGLGDELWREKEKCAMAWLEVTLPTLQRALTSEVWLGSEYLLETIIGGVS
ncbi:hypothetical protein Galf_1233 [Gallionella capsiferriformans ES-2]|uniref:Uncharacterized protein n=2 Tax=Gallionella TaxID=96 RepID=D9SFG4_GALCS|nr:hypothetical protein Galf_1233 [Gallionella capsiferriformans ES-2]